MEKRIDLGLIESLTLFVNMDKEEKKLILELICNEQIHMIIKDHMKYESEKYKELEKLKVKIKDL